VFASQISTFGHSRKVDACSASESVRRTSVGHDGNYDHCKQPTNDNAEGEAVQPWMRRAFWSSPEVHEWRPRNDARLSNEVRVVHVLQGMKKH